MKAAWYEKQGAARDVLTVGEMDVPQPLAGEVRIRIAVSGVNPGIATYASDVFRPEIPSIRMNERERGKRGKKTRKARKGFFIPRFPRLSFRDFRVLSYSYLKAIIGSTRVARRAGR